jgi:hypothetical protein
MKGTPTPNNNIPIAININRVPNIHLTTHVTKSSLTYAPLTDRKIKNVPNINQGASHITKIVK